jgi:hypothetical protein
MMLFSLAQTSTPEAAAAAQSAATTGWQLPTHWPAQTDLLQAAQEMSPGVAALLVLAGVVYLIWGFYIFRILVTLNAAVVGGYLGLVIAQNSESQAVAVVVGALVAAMIAWPLMKYAVAVMGAIFGALLGASVWRTFGLMPEVTWAGAAIGFVALGMFAFILFRASIMMYTSLQGSVMLVFGILGMIYKYQSVAPSLTDSLTVKPFLLPILILVPAMAGIIYQQSAYAGGGGGGEKK